ncbi:hypothetical protein [Pseudactinotalea sp. HY158]|uniref:hypothetical protein n=1 Tax=Pseudactinotalea sp. HY158 TaxID=2654547 RepID=UPI00129D1963|nr:hypothetical protein [Pseudactinotalea sp. HY158]QGH70098.1 hypothetical protein GCE65_11710 [Pseudactinotalea sp. HY158]
MTATPADDPATQLDASSAAEPGAPAHTCEHCDSTEDHSHVDERSAVLAYRSAMRATDVLRALIATALLVVAVMLSSGGLLAGAGAWLLATAVGMGVLSIATRTRPIGQSVLLGALVSAAAVPLLALAVSQLVGPGWRIGLAAGAGWLVLAGGTEILRNRGLATTLVAHTREGEAARAAVAAGAPTSPWVDWSWSLLTGALFGVWVWLTGELAIAVVTLVPLQVALAALSRRLTHRRA